MDDVVVQGQVTCGVGRRWGNASDNLKMLHKVFLLRTYHGSYQCPSKSSNPFLLEKEKIILLRPFSRFWTCSFEQEKGALISTPTLYGRSHFCYLATELFLFFPRIST